MERWLTLCIETEYFDFDVDVEVHIEKHEPIIEDVGVGPGLVVDPGGVSVTVLTVEMEGKKMPSAFIKKIEDNIEDLIENEEL